MRGEDKIGVDLGIGESLIASGLMTGAEVDSAASIFATIGSYASVISSGVSALGALQKGNASAAAANYNSQVAAQNAQLAEQQSRWASQVGEEKVAQQGMKTRANVGAIMAAQAANNLDVHKGSTVDVRSSAASLGELSAINIRSNAAREAYGMQSQATSYKAQSQLDKFQSQQDRIAGEVGAASTLIGGIGDANLQYKKFLNQSSPLTLNDS